MNTWKTTTKDFPKVAGKPAPRLQIQFGGNTDGLVWFAIINEGNPGGHIFQGFLDDPRVTLSHLEAAIKTAGK